MTAVTQRSIGALMALLATGCGVDSVAPPCPPQSALHPAFDVRPVSGDVVPLPATPFDALFVSAGRAFDVDPHLLKAMAWVETRFHMVVPGEHDDHHGLPPAWGVMALRGERLEEGARLAGVAVDEARTGAAANIAAAAALLAHHARESGSTGRTPDAWGEALMRWSGIDLGEGRRAWAHAVLQARMQAASQAGAVRGAATPGSTTPGAASPGGATPGGAAAGTPTVGRAATTASSAALADCEPPAPPPSAVRTVWRPSPNFNDRMAGTGGRISMIIVHTCEGGYIGCWSWLANTASGVSAHYVVNEEGSEVSHLVHEERRAWHIGATYDCTLNRSRRCDLNGVQSNHFTVGIEHAGYASQSSFPLPQIDVSAQLVCAITRAHGVPRDFQHIVAHGQLQPWNRTDPGPNWPWIRYVALAQRHCGEVVVDDDLAWNDVVNARTASSTAWTATSTTPGFYGGGYRWASTAPGAHDPLVFEFHVARSGRHIVEARWTAGSNRTPAARFSVRTSSGQLLAETTADQRQHHDTWRVIADLNLAAGWHRVELSRDGATGSVVVGDAVRIRAVM